MEIINGVERRRRWRVEDKLRIVAETEQPGVNFLDVARRYDISRGLLWNWRQQVRRGTLTAAVEPQFVSLRVLAEPSAPLEPESPKTPSEDRQSNTRGGTVEIVLLDGVTVRVIGEVEASALRRVLSVLRG